MQLDEDTEVHPGHTDPPTIGEEWESNPFIRVWRGVDPEGDEEDEGKERIARILTRKVGNDRRV